MAVRCRNGGAGGNCKKKSDSCGERKNRKARGAGPLAVMDCRAAVAVACHETQSKTTRRAGGAIIVAAL